MAAAAAAVGVGRRRAAAAAARRRQRAPRGARRPAARAAALCRPLHRQSGARPPPLPATRRPRARPSPRVAACPRSARATRRLPPPRFRVPAAPRHPPPPHPLRPPSRQRHRHRHLLSLRKRLVLAKRQRLAAAHPHAATLRNNSPRILFKQRLQVAHLPGAGAAHLLNQMWCCSACKAPACAPRRKQQRAPRFPLPRRWRWRAARRGPRDTLRAFSLPPLLQRDFFGAEGGAVGHQPSLYAVGEGWTRVQRPGRSLPRAPGPTRKPWQGNTRASTLRRLRDPLKSVVGMGVLCDDGVSAFPPHPHGVLWGSRAMDGCEEPFGTLRYSR